MQFYKYQVFNLYVVNIIPFIFYLFKMKNIVIVGGGFAGTQVAKALEKQLVKLKDQECRIILVEKVYTYYTHIHIQKAYHLLLFMIFRKHIFIIQSVVFVAQ